MQDKIIFTHLPAAIAAALADYDQRVASGALKFDQEGFAAGNAGQAQADHELGQFVAAHIPLSM